MQANSYEKQTNCAQMKNEDEDSKNLTPLQREMRLSKRFVWFLHCISDRKPQNSNKHFQVSHILGYSLVLSAFWFL